MRLKKYLIIMVALLITVATPIDNVSATSGKLRSNTIIKCNGSYYGQHSSDNHWHKAEKKSSGYYAVGNSLGTKFKCNGTTTTTNKSEKIKATLTSCVDGDTAKFKTSKGTYTARFLAIDTPESVHPTIKPEPFGKKASEFTCSSLKKAKTIILETDGNSTKYDKYNRLLVWVWTDNKLLQDEIIKKGYGEVAYLYGNYKYTNRLKDSQKVAKNKKLGIWSLK